MRKINCLLLILLLQCSVVFSQQFANSVVTARIGGRNNASTNLNAVIGPPEISDWNLNTFVALGGGFIIVDLGVKAINGSGSDLRIYEVGESYPIRFNIDPVTQPFYVLGNKENSPANWKYLGRYQGDIVEIDFDSFGVDTVRFVAIFDLEPTSANSNAGTPGADIDAIEILNVVTSVQQTTESNEVRTFALHQNFPNPFNPSTTIQYELVKQEFVELEIYNQVGQKIRTLINANHKAGEFSIAWGGMDDTGNQVASGIYYYKLTSSGKFVTKQMILLK